MKQVYTIYAGLINQHTFKNQTVFSVRFDKHDEDDKVLDEFDSYIILNIYKSLTQSDINWIDVRSQIERNYKIKKRRTQFGDLVNFFNDKPFL